MQSTVKLLENRILVLTEELNSLRNSMSLASSFWENQQVLHRKQNMEFALKELEDILCNLKSELETTSHLSPSSHNYIFSI